MDSVLEPEPLDDLLPTTPTPEAPEPLPTPEVPIAPVPPAPALATPPTAPEPATPVLTPPPPPPMPVVASAPAAAPTWNQVAEPTSPPALPHFSPVAAAPTTPQPADNAHVSEDEWLKIATKRRGSPELASVGWTLVLIGTALIAATYYWGVTYGNLFAPAGIRGDLIGTMLLIIGLIVAMVFMFLPKERNVGLTPDAPDQDVENLVRYTNGQVLVSQILAGVGFGLVLLGVVWMAYWLRAAYVDDTDLRSTFGGMDTATHFIGVPLSAIGLLILFFFLGRLSSARRARNAAVLLWIQRRSGAPKQSLAPSSVFSTGVTEQQVQDLMKRLDGLMAQLPDAAVTEFSKSNEADTYLKLLGS